MKLLWALMLFFLLTVSFSCANSRMNDFSPLFKTWQVESLNMCSLERLYTSPDENFSIEKRVPCEDSFEFVLCLSSQKSSKKIVLGYGSRDIDVIWHRTQIGYIAEINHAYDTHSNEIFIVYPELTNGQDIKINLLYKTPSHHLLTKEARYPLNHSYWTVEQLSESGVLKISGIWTFRENTLPPNIGTFNIPLFYGIGILK